MARNMITGKETQKMQEYTQEQMRMAIKGYKKMYQK